MSEPDLQGWMFPAEQQWLYETAFMLPDDAVIVEIGSWKGLSTSNLCRGCRGTNKRVYAVDTWQGCSEDQEGYYSEAQSKDIYQIFTHNMKTLGYADSVVPIKGESSEVAKEFPRKIDFLFVDGDHREASIRRDLAAWVPHCKKNAIIAGHDFAFWEPDIKKVIPDVFEIYCNPVDSIWRSAPRFYRPLQTTSIDSAKPPTVSEAKISLITMAYNFSKRLKICLESLRLQKLEKNAFEIIIANPQSPDDLLNIIEYFRTTHPLFRIRVVTFAPSIGLDRGRMYNELAWAANGKILCLMDADAVLPTSALQTIEFVTDQHPQRYHSCFRRDVPQAIVEQFLTGELRLEEHFHQLQASAKPVQASCWASYAGKIGFFQIVYRDTFLKVNYPERYFSVAETDVTFANSYIRYTADCRSDYRIPGLEIYHLDHLRCWEGVPETQ